MMQASKDEHKTCCLGFQLHSATTWPSQPEYHAQTLWTEIHLWSDHLVNTTSDPEILHTFLHSPRYSTPVFFFFYYCFLEKGYSALSLSVSAFWNLQINTFSEILKKLKVLKNAELLLFSGTVAPNHLFIWKFWKILKTLKIYIIAFFSRSAGPPS